MHPGELLIFFFFKKTDVTMREGQKVNCCLYCWPTVKKANSKLDPFRAPCRLPFAASHLHALLGLCSDCRNRLCTRSVVPELALRHPECGYGVYGELLAWGTWDGSYTHPTRPGVACLDVPRATVEAVTSHTASVSLFPLSACSVIASSWQPKLHLWYVCCIGWFSMIRASGCFKRMAWT